MPPSAPRSRSRQSPLARVLASPALARLVVHFVVRPHAALHFRALQRATGLSSRSLQQELARLEELGMIRRGTEGRMVRYAPVPDHPRWRVFREMVRAFTEPADVLRAAFADVPGVEGAFVHGSYARGTDVHPGSDVDVFVIGEAMEDAEARVELAGRTLEAAGLLGREVNVTRYTPRKLATRWASGARFVRSVLTGDKEWIVGDESVLSGVEGAEP